jgi:MoxR-like ATPase
MDMTPEQCGEVLQQIRQEVASVIVGQHDLVSAALRCLLAEGHLLVEGVPGLGKTEMLKALSLACGLTASRIQFTPDLMPADITGTQVIEESGDGRRTFEFRAGPIFAGFVLADEINRATPKTQSALLEAMAERTVTAAGATRPLPRPFLVMATQNPIEQEGTYPLPEAQLDRFMAKAVVPFPTAGELTEILRRTTRGERMTARQVTDVEQLRSLVALTREVPIADHLLEHAVALVMATQPDSPTAPDRIKKYVRVGSSPRGAQALVLLGKAAALSGSRANVSAVDIRQSATSVLSHRLVTGYEAVADGVSTDDLIADVLSAVPEPTVTIRGV